MLAELLKVPVAVIRRWQRRGLIVPVREVRRLPYFDFQEVATARRLAELLAAGVSPRAIERKLEVFARYLPDVARPLAQLSVIVQGKEILLRQGDGLIEPGGQLRFDFDAWQAEPAQADSQSSRDSRLETCSTDACPCPPRPSRCAAWPPSWRKTANWPRRPRCIARRWPPADRRPKSASRWPNCSIGWAISAAARERYYMAVELDEDYVEARANLGCVLAETGQRELAVAAFEGRPPLSSRLCRRSLSSRPHARRVAPPRRGGEPIGGRSWPKRPTVPGPKKPAGGWGGSHSRKPRRQEKGEGRGEKGDPLREPISSPFSPHPSSSSLATGAVRPLPRPT